MTLALLARGVCKSFGGGGTPSVPILRGVGMGVAARESVFLVGPSGSGKTTLLSVLGCLLRPDEGSVQVLGQDVSRLGPAELTDFRRRHLGFVFQGFNLFPTLSALDNISLVLTMRGLALRPARAQAEELLSQVGLTPRAHLRPGQLSGGECQRVAIARALANEPAVLLADEPTAALDVDNGQSVMRLLTGFVCRCGATLIVVTHDQRIFPFADRILHLTDGRLTGAWSPKAPPPPALFKESVA
jgi:putative ABC transport system ATP-binding protein